MGSYNNSTLVGNWSEERLKNEFELKLSLRKRERGELLLQRSRTLFTNVLMEKPLHICGINLAFGCQVQIIASDSPALIVNNKLTYGLALSALVDDKQVDYTQQLIPGCLMTMSPILSPCSRNSFIISSGPGESKHGETLRYGQEFMLQQANYANKSAPPLYVGYQHSGIVPAPSESMPIYLSSIPDTNCRWKALNLHAKQRVELEGQPIERNSKVILRNCVADKNLCVMNQCWMKTIFGPECGITLRNCVDARKRTTAENVIKIFSDVQKLKPT